MQLEEREKYMLKRKRADITVKQVSEHCKCHFTFISKCERGDRKMSDEMFKAYASYIDERQ